MAKQKLNIPALRFPGFKGEWKEKRLEELGENIIGLTYSPTDVTNNNEGIIVLRSSNIKEDALDLNDLVRVECPINPTLIIQKNDILICTRNGSQRLIGKNILIDKVEIPMTFGAFMSVFRSPQNKFNVHLLKTNAYRRQIDENLGARINQITTRNLNKFKFYMPDDLEQKRIADFLIVIDHKIAQLTEKKSYLEQYKKGVMQRLFTQRFRFRDANGNPFPDWEEKPLSTFLIPTIREIDKPKKNYLAIGVRSHCKGTFQKPESEPDKIEMDKLYVVKENDLIVNITFAWEGAIALVKKEDEGGLVSHRFPTYTFNKKIMLHEFFQYSFIQKKFLQTLELISPGGAGRNRVLSKSAFLKMECFVPHVQEQQKIADFLTAIDAKITVLGKQLTAAQDFKKFLLQNMFV